MSTTTVGVMSRPDPEVRPAAKVYSAAFKAEVLAELDAVGVCKVVEARTSAPPLGSRPCHGIAFIVSVALRSRSLRRRSHRRSILAHSQNENTTTAQPASTSIT